MKLDMKLGADPKKTAVLVVLVLAAVVIYFRGGIGIGDESGASSAPKTAPKTAPRVPVVAQQMQAADPDTVSTPTPAAGKAASRDFRPVLKRKGETIDPERFDPTLRTDLLQKLAAVRVERVERSLFDFSSAHPAGPAKPAAPKQPEPKVVLKPVFRAYGPAVPPPPPVVPPPPPPPPPPPITLKFYGRALPVGSHGVKRVFCIVNNDEVLSPAEGEVVQRRYKIHRITATNVLVEDLQYKHQQTLPIEEPAQGGN